MLLFLLELLQILTPYRKLGFTDQRLSPSTWEIPRFLYTFVLTLLWKKSPLTVENILLEKSKYFQKNG